MDQVPISSLVEKCARALLVKLHSWLTAPRVVVPPPLRSCRPVVQDNQSVVQNNQSVIMDNRPVVQDNRPASFLGAVFTGIVDGCDGGQSMRCGVCRMVVPLNASVCPFCRESPTCVRPLR